jgi:hypothetical protein
MNTLRLPANGVRLCSHGAPLVERARQLTERREALGITWVVLHLVPEDVPTLDEIEPYIRDIPHFIVSFCEGCGDETGLRPWEPWEKPWPWTSVLDKRYQAACEIAAALGREPDAWLLIVEPWNTNGWGKWENVVRLYDAAFNRFAHAGLRPNFLFCPALTPDACNLNGGDLIYEWGDIPDYALGIDLHKYLQRTDLDAPLDTSYWKRWKLDVGPAGRKPLYVTTECGWGGWDAATQYGPLAGALWLHQMIALGKAGVDVACINNEAPPLDSPMGEVMQAVARSGQ